MPSENNRRRPPNRKRGQKGKTDPAANSSPFAGCTIVGAAIFVMAFLIGFTFWSLTKMDRALKGFTETSARPTPLLDPANHEAAFNDLSRRLDGFRAAVLAEEEAALSLSPHDLNLAIASHDQFKNLRTNFTVQEITPEEITIDVSYPMRGHPFGDGSGRFLNGTLHGKPQLESGQILLQLSKIDSVKGRVPEEFVGHLSDHQITAPYLEDDSMGPILKQLTSVSLGEDALILKVDPAAQPPGQQPITREEIDNTRRIALISFGIVGTLFVLFLVVFLRKSKRKKKDNPSTGPERL
jgi:hypothetical protein